MTKGFGQFEWYCRIFTEPCWGVTSLFLYSSLKGHCNLTKTHQYLTLPHCAIKFWNIGYLGTHLMASGAVGGLVGQTLQRKCDCLKMFLILFTSDLCLFHQALPKAFVFFLLVNPLLCGGAILCLSLSCFIILHFWAKSQPPFEIIQRLCFFFYHL